MKVEEAALTGESVPVTKFIDLIHLRNNANDVPLGDRKNMMYMGSTVVYGRGSAVVTATGMDTEMGKIADALANAQEGQTPLQRKLTQLSGILTKLVLVICVLIFGVQLLRAGEFTLDVVLHSFMVAVSLAVAAIPEGLAAVVTVVLSIGVTNMSKRSAIIRRLTAVETLGCAQIICSDKTGAPPPWGRRTAPSPVSPPRRRWWHGAPNAACPSPVCKRNCPVWGKHPLTPAAR